MMTERSPLIANCERKEASRIQRAPNANTQMVNSRFIQNLPGFLRITLFEESVTF